MKMDDHIFQAIQACWQRTATPKDIELVQGWLEESEEHRDIFEEINRIHYRLVHARKWQQIDANQGKASLNKQLERKHSWKYISAGIAAACLITFGIIYFFQQEPVKKINTLNIARIQSGSRKATLILDNGEKIPLGTSHSFRLQAKDVSIQNEENTGLKYEISGRAFDTSTNEYNKLVVSRGGEYILTLSDGTKVWLNSETELKYPVRFAGSRREVHVKGEAFFQVREDSLHPFIVHTPHTSTRVLGTSFNVMAYEEENITAITLVQGKVEVNHREEKCILEPGWQVVANNHSNKMKKQKVNVTSHVSWKEGMFEFNDMTLNQLIIQLSRWYDVDFFFMNDTARDVKFTGAVKRNNTLMFMLEFIEKTSNVYFKVNGNVIQIYEK